MSEARRRVFCASLADVFDNEVDPQWRLDLFDLIECTPNLDWLLLTKRIGNVASMVSARWNHRLPDNVWLGATVCNQEEAERDIPKLLAVNARVRFVSIEPMLGPIDFSRMWIEFKNPAIHQNILERIDWVIVGGESGLNARPMHPWWVMNLRDQCVALSVPFLFKQWGEWVQVAHCEELQGDGLYTPDCTGYRYQRTFCSLDGARFSDCRVAPDGVVTLDRCGKRIAGRLLNGREWNEFPQQEGSV